RRVEAIEDLPPHEGLEIQRMSVRQEPALPIEEFIHVEGIDVAPTDALAVGNLDHLAVLHDRPDREDQARRLSAGGSGSNLADNRLSKVVQRIRDRWDQSKWNAGVLPQFVDRKRLQPRQLFRRHETSSCEQSLFGV